MFYNQKIRKSFVDLSLACTLSGKTKKSQEEETHKISTESKDCIKNQTNITYNGVRQNDSGDNNFFDLHKGQKN